MKKYLIIFIWLSVVSCAYGAHFTYYDGHVRATAHAFAKDGTNESGPETDICDSDEYCEAKKILIAGGATNGTVSAACQKIASVIDPCGGDDLVFLSGPVSLVRAYNSPSRGDANAIGSTQDAETYGIFYQIDPDGNQQVGEPVRVWYEWRITVTHYAGSSTYAYAGGPRDGNDGAYEDMSYMAITRNIYPPVTGDFEPEDLINVEWCHPNVEIEDDDYFESSRQLRFHPWFEAQIGDVIGIFAENQALIDVDNQSIESITGSVTIILRVSWLHGDLDTDGDVDWEDFAIFSKNWLAGK